MSKDEERRYAAWVKDLKKLSSFHDVPEKILVKIMANHALFDGVKELMSWHGAAEFIDQAEKDFDA